MSSVIYITGSGNVVFNNQVGSISNPFSSIDIAGTTTINGGGIYTSGSQQYTGAVFLGADTILNAANSTINFSSTVNSATSTPESLAITTTAQTTFNGAVGGSHALNNLTITNTADLNGNTITTTGNQLYSGAITLGTNNLLSAGTGTISFGSTIDSATATAENLTLTTTGITTLNGSVGSSHALK